MKKLIEEIIKELNGKMEVSHIVKEDVDNCYREVLSKHLINKQMKIKEIIELSNAIQGCGNLSGIKFVYAMAKNNKILKPEIESVQEALNKLREEYATKDKDGEFVTEQTPQGKMFKIKDKKKFSEEEKKLLETEVELPELYKIKEKEVPDNITVSQLSGIMDLVE